MIAGSILMVGDAEEPFAGREAAGPTHVSPHIYLDDVDAAATQATEAGATLLRAPQDMFCGDRSAMLRGPSVMSGSC
jgi:PhnB protein